MPDYFNDPELADKAAQILKAVAHPIRLRILDLLALDRHNVGQLAEAIGVNQSIVSQQLRILRAYELVGVERKGGFATYWLAEQKVRNLLMCVSGCLGAREDSDDDDAAAKVPEDHGRRTRRRRTR